MAPPKLAPQPNPRAKPKPAAPTADELLTAAQQAPAAGESTTASERYQTLADQYGNLVGREHAARESEHEHHEHH